MDKERIKAEADAFFEWPTSDRTHVTTTSMLIFANVIADIAAAEEREACAKVCEAEAESMEKGAQDAIENGEHDEVSSCRSTAWKLSVAANRIRKRSNAMSGSKPAL